MTNRNLIILFLAIVIASKALGQQLSVPAKITGDVRYHRAVQGIGVKERDIIVWLPPGYTSSQQKYPVVYMQDGQNLFDPTTGAFGNEWRIDETADSMMRVGVITPAIIVGIYNTSNRSDEYLPGENGKPYRDFLAKKVKPFIDSVYRTIPDRASTIVGGSSAGGVLAFMMVWEYPDIFSKAISMSPAFMNPAGFSSRIFNYLPNVEQRTSRPRKVFFYIDNGGKDLDSLLQPGVMAMVNALKGKGYKERRHYSLILDPSATHNEAAWAKRYPSALKTVLGIRLR